MRAGRWPVSVSRGLLYQVLGCGGLAFAFAAGCAPLHPGAGAVPLADGTREVYVAASLQGNATRPQAGASLALPVVEVGRRRSLTPDLDWGLRVGATGVHADVRRRLGVVRGWHVAVVPEVGGVVLPALTVWTGSLDLTLPLVVERPLAGGWSLGARATTLLREPFVGVVGQGLEGRLEVLAGGALRAAHVGPRATWGVALGVLAQPAWALPPAWTVGVDLTRVRPVGTSKSRSGRGSGAR